MTMSEIEKTLRIGISACVLGHEVRFDGGHKLDRYIRDRIGSFADFVPICPEKDIGLGIPRETLRLVHIAGREPALLAPKSQSDHSERMRSYARAKAEELRSLDLCGFIVKKNSPSCGMSRVKVYPAAGVGSPSRDGRGTFTRELMDALPLLPVEEDGRLQDPVLRENFLDRVFAYRRLRDFFSDSWQHRELMKWHAKEKLLLMAHADYKPLGQLVAHGHDMAKEQLEADYKQLFMTALAKPTTVGKHSNVLQHIAGYFRGVLDSASRAEVHEQIEAYRKRLLPLTVPLTLIKHHIRKLDLGYLQEQTYLLPAPAALALRNHS